MDTYRRWGITPRPENFAASGSARQYKKETGGIKDGTNKNMDLNK